MKRYLYLIVVTCLIALFNSCEPKSGDSNTKKDSVVGQELKEKRYYSGQADKPANEFQITSAGLGQLILGDSIEKVLNLLKLKAAQIEDKAFFDGGKEWPSKRIQLQNGYYISLAMVNTIDLVTSIQTNDPAYSSKSGIHVGLSLDSINTSLDSIKSDYEHRSFTIGDEGVWFKIDKKSEDNFFKSNSPSSSLLKGAKIEELFIVCGDC